MEYAMMSKYFTNLLKPTLFIIAATLSMPTFATDDSKNIDMQELRQKISIDKRQIVENNMHLTDTEAKAFWPIYDAYQNDLQQINQRIANLINSLALAENMGAVLNSTAKTLLDEAIAIQLDEAKLRKSYVPKLSKALPLTKVARYSQIEFKIRAIVYYELAGAIPLIE